jgi:Flp pilus assembly protein TadB
MGIWIELGIFAIALAFGLWQIHDVKKARETTRRQRESERERERAQSPAPAQSPSPEPRD